MFPERFGFRAWIGIKCKPERPLYVDSCRDVSDLEIPDIPRSKFIPQVKSPRIALVFILFEQGSHCGINR
jgi:hypothetical protein